MTEDQKAALDKATTRAIKGVRTNTDRIKKTCGPIAAAQVEELKKK